MQFDSLMEVFDSTAFTPEHPLSPEGELFSYVPFEEPEALHYHDFMEIGYCVRGAGLFYVDGDVIPFNGPCCSLIYGGQIHIAQSVTPEKSLWHFLYIDLKMLFTGADFLALSGLKAFSPHLYDFPPLITREQDAELCRLCLAVMEESAQLREGYLTAVRGLMTALLTRHSRYMTASRHPRGGQARLLERLGGAMSYINQNYMNDITIDQLTQAGGVSKSTLQRDMILFTGMAPLQYIHYLRMKRAAAMLLGGGYSIAKIASDVGYNTLSSFNRHFIRAFGASPSKWRKAALSAAP